MKPTRRIRRGLIIGVLLPTALATAALGGAALGALGAGAPIARADVAQTQPARSRADRFQHAKHEKMFPTCVTCHAGVVDASQAMWPEPSQCVSCHDGVVKPRITWQPRTGVRAGNVRFTHEAHHRAATAKNPADSGLARDCTTCHTERGAPRMAVQNAVAVQCTSCHGFTTPHVDVPSEACATCHVRLADALGLTREDIASFPKPRSHEAPGFVLGGHGKEAKGPGSPGTPRAVAASCATCHAQNFCVACHVNAPEVPEIRALAMDARSPDFTGSLPTPSSHAAPAFLRTHGQVAQRGSATCATCHAEESCSSCHVGAPPRAVAALPSAGPGRAPGARVLREAPPSHTREFTERHSAEASARPATCEGCHVRETCLECHRPEASRQAKVLAKSQGARRSSFHPPSFLTRHPSSAYTREANCSDCHNPAQFCQSCHQQSGLVATSRIGQRGYHDVFQGFSLGHGQAARQSLESCVSCHAERDCTVCHSAVAGGFRFSPHGPGFNASRMRSKNPTLCTACHGNAIPSSR
jgi:hypothetical protein